MGDKQQFLKMYAQAQTKRLFLELSGDFFSWVYRWQRSQRGETGQLVVGFCWLCWAHRWETGRHQDKTSSADHTHKLHGRMKESWSLLTCHVCSLCRRRRVHETDIWTCLSTGSQSQAWHQQHRHIHRHCSAASVTGNTSQPFGTASQKNSMKWYTGYETDRDQQKHRLYNTEMHKDVWMMHGHFGTNSKMWKLISAICLTIA